MKFRTLGLAARLLVIPAVLTQPATAQTKADTQSRQAPDRKHFSTDADELAARVYRRLARSPSLEGSDIRVTPGPGTVTLAGVVRTDAARARAERIARRTYGVPDVRNELRVEPAKTASGARPADSDLSRTVAEKLVSELFSGRAHVERDFAFGWEVEGNGWEFEIDVDSGDVVLDGTVPNMKLLTEAVRVAHRVPGVRSVDTRLWPVNEGIRRTGWNPLWNENPYFFDPY